MPIISAFITYQYLYYNCTVDTIPWWKKILKTLADQVVPEVPQGAWRRGCLGKKLPVGEFTRRIGCLKERLRRIDVTFGRGCLKERLPQLEVACRRGCLVEKLFWGEFSKKRGCREELLPPEFAWRRLSLEIATRVLPNFTVHTWLQVERGQMSLLLISHMP